MATELILLENVKDLGQVGDVVRVADGYARNYLLPRGFAERMNKSSLRKVEARKVALQKQYEENLNIAKTLGEKVAGLTITITAEANEEGKLYGSVNERQIAEAVSAAAGVEVNAHNVELAEVLRLTGDYDVTIDLHPEVRVEVKVTVATA